MFFTHVTADMSQHRGMKTKERNAEHSWVSQKYNKNFFCLFFSFFWVCFLDVFEVKSLPRRLLPLHRGGALWRTNIYSQANGFC